MKWKLFRRASTTESQTTHASEKINKIKKKKKKSGLDCLNGGETADEFIFESFEKKRRSQLDDKENNTIPRMNKITSALKSARLLKSKNNRSFDLISSDEGLPITSSSGELFCSEDNPLAYCPQCHCVVRPITGKRSLIRTNPWLKGKRPRLASEEDEYNDPMQKSFDSGICDSDKVPNNAAQLEVGVHVEEEARDSFWSEKEDSDETMADFTQKRKRRVKKRRKSRKTFESLSQTSGDLVDYQDSLQQQEEMVVGEVMHEGIVRSSFVPCEAQASATPVSLSSGGSSLWWELDRQMLPPEDTPDEDNSSLDLSFQDRFEIETASRMDHYPSETDFDSPLSESDDEFCLAPPTWENPHRLDAVQESLTEKLQRLTSQRMDIASRFKDTQFPAAIQADQECFERELQRYRKELLLRTLATVRDQLDSQMNRLEESYSAVINSQVRQARELFVLSGQQRRSCPPYQDREELPDEDVLVHYS